MKIFTACLCGVFLTCSASASAALAPWVQANQDFHSIVDFIHQHPKVMNTLRTIDFQQKTVTFGPPGENCLAEFGREPWDHPPGFVGPAKPLQLRASNCPVE